LVLAGPIGPGPQRAGDRPAWGRHNGDPGLGLVAMQRVLRPVGRQADTTVQALTRLPGPSHTGSRHPPRAVRRRGAATSARR